MPRIARNVWPIGTMKNELRNKASRDDLLTRDVRDVYRRAKILSATTMLLMSDALSNA